VHEVVQNVNDGNTVERIGSQLLRVRHEYRLELGVENTRTDLRAPIGIFLRAITPDDVLNLAELMLDAYRDTIDYEGEGIAEAVAEVEGYFLRAAKHPAIAQHSLVLGFEDSIACACLLEFWERRSVPFVGFVMCRSTNKRQGLATYALQEVIDNLKGAGCSELRTIITEGNTPSEALFARAGFRRVD